MPYSMGNFQIRLLLFSICLANFDWFVGGLPIAVGENKGYYSGNSVPNTRSTLRGNFLQNLWQIGTSFSKVRPSNGTQITDVSSDGVSSNQRTDLISLLNTEYIIEKFPTEEQGLGPRQWIFFRLCTIPIKACQHTVASSFESAMRNELLCSSCVLHDSERHPFPSSQQLVIEPEGHDPVVVYDIDSMQVSTMHSPLAKDNAHFWRYKSKNVLLFAIRPNSWLANLSSIQIELKLFIDPTIVAAISKNHPLFQKYHVTFDQQSITILLLKVSLPIHKDGPPIELSCNKTKPFMFFRPWQNAVGFGWAAIDDIPNSVGANRDDKLDPDFIAEQMNEMAIRKAQQKLQADNDIPIHPFTQLLIPSEPVEGTRVFMIMFGETIKLTCRGHVKGLPIKMVYDTSVWNNVSHVLSHTDNIVNVTLKAVEVTWPRVPLSAVSPDSSDQLTSIKCGSAKNDPPWNAYVDELYFTVLTAVDYELLTMPVHPAATDNGAISSSLFPIKISITKGDSYSSSELDKNSGFWNFSLTKLSGTQLITSFVFVIILILMLLLTIRHVSKRFINDTSSEGSSNSTSPWSTRNSVSSSSANFIQHWYRILFRSASRDTPSVDANTDIGLSDVSFEASRPERVSTRNQCGTRGRGLLVTRRQPRNETVDHLKSHF